MEFPFGVKLPPSDEAQEKVLFLSEKWVNWQFQGFQNIKKVHIFVF